MVLPDVSKLLELTAGELELHWRTHFGASAPKHLPKFLLARLLAYKLQVELHGGLSKSATRLFDQVADDLEAGREPALPYPADQKLKPGSVIVREHDGVDHKVMVLEEGFAWNGKTFTSLSSVAKAITGTNWNGQRFFGLKVKQQSAGQDAA